MSYDYPEGYEPPPLPKLTLWGRVVHRYWGFVLWCALDAKSPWLNRWGDRRLWPRR